LFYKGEKLERGENWFHKTQVFHSVFSVYFLFANSQLNNQKTTPSLKKYWGWRLPPCCPQVTPMSIITVV
jgi:hypothetical protein